MLLSRMSSQGSCCYRESLVGEGAAMEKVLSGKLLLLKKVLSGKVCYQESLVRKGAAMEKVLSGKVLLWRKYCQGRCCYRESFLKEGAWYWKNFVREGAAIKKVLSGNVLIGWVWHQTNSKRRLKNNDQPKTVWRRYSSVESKKIAETNWVSKEPCDW